MTDLIVDQAAAHAAGSPQSVDVVETASAAECALHGAENDVGAADVSANDADDASVIALGPRDAAIIFHDDGGFDAHLPKSDDGKALPAGLSAAAVLLALTDKGIRSLIQQNFYREIASAAAGGGDANG